MTRSRRLVVLAGGEGSRLRAFTRRRFGRDLAKQFCRFDGGRSLLQETLRRFSPLVPASDTVAVVQASQAKLARRHLLEFPGARTLPQPSNRGTGAAILFALNQLPSDALVLVTPADHGVANSSLFCAGIERGCRAVEEGVVDVLVCGIEARSARGDYGWLRCGRRLGPALWRVGAFVEKPGPERAQRLRDEGALWNTMILVARAGGLLSLYRREHSGLLVRFASAAGQWPQTYEDMAPLDFSYDVLAGAPGLGVVALPAAVGWTDLGTPERLARWLQPTATSPEG